MNIVFISWLPHCRRSDALAEALGGRSYLVHHLKFKRPLYAPFKYVLQTITTLRLLLRERPNLVLVASPPVMAVLAVWGYARLCGVAFVVDAHTGVFDDRRWSWFLPLSRFLSRQAELTIVTSKYLCAEIERWGGKAMVIGDVPIRFPTSPNVSLGEGFHVVMVNTFSSDEPLKEILNAVMNTQGVFLHVTGDLGRASSKVLEQVPRNVRFTGWLPDEDYIALLGAADAVMVLTSRDHTMQRGAYEAMALAKPLITSDWPLLRETFHLGTVHVSNRAQDIQRGLLYTMDQVTRLRTEMHELKVEREKLFALKQEELCQFVSLNNRVTKEGEFVKP